MKQNLNQLVRVIYLFFFLTSLAGYLNAQATVNINGFIEEVATREHINGATLFYSEKNRSVIASDAGYFSIKINKGDSVTLIISHTSYETFILKLSSFRDTFLTIFLQPLARELTEIQIKSEGEVAGKERIGTISIPIKKLAKLPSLFGEKDIIKAVQLMPGVQMGNEGNTGYYVRGGGADQNLILLDGVTIYNVSHLFGFFSLFPTDAVKSVELIKGGFPARYGGRLSSVLDIKLKDGNKQKIETNVSAGLLSSKVSIEGPIMKKGASFMVTGRRTYFDLLTKPFLSKENNKSGYNFYDGIAKLNFILSSKSILSISAYSGKDNYSASTGQKNYSTNGDLESKTTATSSVAWGNFTAAIRWNLVLNSRMNLTQSLNYTRYKYKNSFANKTSNTGGNTLTEKSFTFNYTTSVNDIGYKSELDWFVSNKVKIKSGAGYTQHLFNPSSTLIKWNNNGMPLSESQNSGAIHTKEIFLYSEADILYGKRTQISTGFHSSYYIATKKNFVSIQPRLNGKYILNSKSNLQYSFSYTFQPIHLLTNNGLGLPVDLWVPATKNVPPQKATQYSLGYFIKPWLGYEFSVDAYYKKMYGIIEYAEGADFANSVVDWEKKVEIGKGISYGTELFLQKKTGSFSGWVGYTLSWSKRKFDNLNNGNWFFYKYDHRHDLKIVFIYEPSKKFDMSFDFVLHSGNRITLPDIVYNGVQGSFPIYYAGFMFDINSQFIYSASSRNNFSFKTYHRADISFNFNKEKKRGTRTWNISIYNIYSRQNPYFYYLKETGSGGLKLTQFSLFPVIPSFSYQFKWK